MFELDDEYAESDIPTTLLRSKADCPTQEVTTLSTNDIVINKLTQILSYLRQGSRSGKKGRKKDKGLHSSEIWCIIVLERMYQCMPTHVQGGFNMSSRHH